MKNKFYITTTIPYVNAPLHIGHALEFLYADVLSRYYRARGVDVLFLTGTDEHGKKMERAAKVAGVTSQELADKNSKTARDLKDILNISWDRFIRTTDQKKHYPGVYKVWKELEKSGNLYKKKYSGMYCVGCEAFLTDRDIEDGKCKIHHKELELVEEENYFFRLSAYSRTLKQKIQSGQLKIFPDWRAKEALSLIEGLEDISFSRPSEKSSWSIVVPNDESQTIYVWVDALINYISAIGYGRNDKDFKKWWPADVQILGKDVLKFHTVIWPAILIALNLPLPDTLFIHGFITVGGQKMSKSVGNVLSPQKLVKKYKIDPVRYYFLREFSSFEDGDFLDDKFLKRYNGDLANGLGNFFSRVVSLARSFSVIKNNPSSIELGVENYIKNTSVNIEKNLLEFKFNDAIASIWDLITFGDLYINDKKPWEKNKTNTEKEKYILNTLIILNAVSVFVSPFLPDTAKIISNTINLNNSEFRVKKIKQLFPRI